ncbi:phosphonate ABC transporter, permease protein PhnE [Pelagovum pacificum]|uniref:Phosphonate ABC transporter, permease protein PhnE n=1 Tax=Pelagovum pacificum TaxID=2588711 RepID=A0A5C5GGF2_9RHOB|nr:phosphonate ABC transporter, permease protein PhnE [Pelagovum pacificum]QQA43848.1 phosphonate ABC transporter, permease protein PhnE [Pelagovum pacificum]TNY33021.1 phosphonate ABC transporter, permease protein PhnE [Pelagovum pacificum]
MTTATIHDSYLAEVRTRRLWSSVAALLFVLLFLGGFMIADERNAGGFWPGIPHILDFPADVLAEASEQWRSLPGLIAEAFPALIETVNIAGASTLIGGLAGAVIALLVTRGLAPAPWAVAPLRRLLDILRALPELVIALVLIFVLGGGPIPAMIAIALHTVGALGKLFSEVAENASLRPVEGLRSVGATWSQRMMLGILPQVAPNWLSYALLRFEINIRASAILGFVGAGGIGYDLRNAMSFGPGKFAEAAAIFVLLFATIVIVDQTGSALRNRLTKGAAT